MRYLLLALMLHGCDDGSCRCAGDVPEGRVELRCGESVCLGGAGYQCTGAGEATATGACTPAPSSSGSSAQAICQRYMSCVAKAIPDAFPSALQAYGDQSPCWNTSAMAAELCGESCRSGLERSQGFAGESRDCGCQSDQECNQDPALPHCDLATGFCQACTSDAQCLAATPVCTQDPNSEEPKNICLICDYATDQGCPANRPACYWHYKGNELVAECVECLGNDYCPTGYCNYEHCENRCSAVAQCLYMVMVEPNRSDDCGTHCSNGQAYAQCVFQNCKTECTTWDAWTNLGCETCRNQKCAGAPACAPAGAREFDVECTP